MMEEKTKIKYTICIKSPRQYKNKEYIAYTRHGILYTNMYR